MSSDGKRIEALRRLLTEAYQKLGLKLGFSLWDGSRVPADWPVDGLMIAIRDAGVVAALLRKPKLDTLLHLHVSDRIAIENGTIFDLAAARPDGKVGRLARGISKTAAFDVVRHFLFAPGQAPQAVQHIKGDEIARDGKPATNKANIAHHYDVSVSYTHLDMVKCTCSETIYSLFVFLNLLIAHANNVPKLGLAKPKLLATTPDASANMAVNQLNVL